MHRPGYTYWFFGLGLGGIGTPAVAEICETIRPNRTNERAMTLLDEAIALFSTVPSLALFVATLVALRFRSQWGGLVVVVGWTMWVSLLLFVGDQALRAQAIAEGCMAAPTLFIGAVIAICAGTILYTLPRETRL